MTEEKIKKLAEYLAADQERAKLLFSMEPEEVVEKLKADHLDFSLEEIKELGEQIRRSIPENGELDVDQLESVAGGIGVVAALVLCGVGGVVIGVAVNAPW